jgi:NAD+ synthase (glutamine-hydrolysing)
VIVTPELSVTGYPVEDLASSSDFIRQSELGVTALAERIAADGFGDAIVVVGFVERATEEEFGGARAHNSLAVLSQGRVVATYAKRHLPTYSVFDEERIFVPGAGTLIMNLGGVATGFLICEDLWRDDGPVAELAEHDLDVVVVINASPFDTAKDETRFPLLHTRALEFRAPVVYVNAVGGQDDLVFDGDSAVLDAEGTVLLRAPLFTPELELIDITGTDFAGDGIPLTEPSDTVTPSVAQDLPDIEATWNALVLGVRDYTLKNGFPSIVLGLSGGIDSAVCAAIAADAIGADRVFGVSMPSTTSLGIDRRSFFDDPTQCKGLRSLNIDKLYPNGSKKETQSCYCDPTPATPITRRTTSHVLSTSACVNVGCTKNMMDVSPNSRATGSRSAGRQPVPSKAFSRYTSEHEPNTARPRR